MKTLEVTRWPKSLQDVMLSHEKVAGFRLNTEGGSHKAEKTIVCVPCDTLDEIEVKEIFLETLDSIPDECDSLVFTNSINDDGTTNESEVILLSRVKCPESTPLPESDTEEADVAGEEEQGTVPFVAEGDETQKEEDGDASLSVSREEVTLKEESGDACLVVSEEGVMEETSPLSPQRNESSPPLEANDRYSVSESISMSLMEETRDEDTPQDGPHHVRFFSDGGVAQLANKLLDEKEPEWLKYPEDPIGDSPKRHATTSIIYKGTSMESLIGILPPPLLTSLARQRVHVPTVNSVVPLYLQGSKVRVGNYLIDVSTYEDGSYSAVERTKRSGLGSLRRSGSTGNIVQAHRMRRAQSERR